MNRLGRRSFLAIAGGTAAAVVVGRERIFGRRAPTSVRLLPADNNGVRLPDGFSSRVVARTGQRVPGTDYVWHAAPDGGATFAQPDGGWVYVSNSEVGDSRGGASMLRFSAHGDIEDARAILSGTTLNCAGGPTPWGTWLSCEEFALGQVWECDPVGIKPAQARPALGLFNHEAAAVDPIGKAVYLTEDYYDGGLYRFVPNTWEDLASGRLEVLAGSREQLRWQQVPDPTGTEQPTRYQVADMQRFSRGEGAWFADGQLYFATTADNSIWTYRPIDNELRIQYRARDHALPALTGADNVVGATGGAVVVAEDGGNMQLVAVTSNGNATPIAQLTDAWMSEITGPAFDPAGTRLYFSSQRFPGATYEISGPFAQLFATLEA